MTQHSGYPPPGQAFPPPGGGPVPPAGGPVPATPAPGAWTGDPAGSPVAAGYAGSPVAAYGLPMLHKPGIIALRPLGLGDMLDGSIKAIRRNPGATLGLSALVTLACLIPSALIGGALSRLALGNSLRDGTIGSLGTAPASAVELVFTQLATGILSGMLVFVVGEAVLGRHARMGQTWSATRRKVLPVLGAQVIVGLAGFVPTGLVVVAGVALALAGAPWVGVPVAIVGGLGGLALMVWVSTRACMAAPAIVLEGHGVRAALRRSFALTGGAFWRTFGILLLASVLAGIAASMLNAPFSIAGMGAMLVSGPDSLDSLLIMVFVSHLGRLFAGTVTTPFAAGVTALLYIDRRIRLEGLDVTLIRAAQSDAGRQG